ncbi:MAG: hypothetical protein AB7S39_13520 [Gemmatimonadales bacterium]
MIGALWRLQWKSARVWILAGAFAAGLLPVVSVSQSWPSGERELAQFLAQLDVWSLFYPALAVGLGLIMAAVVGRDDRRGAFVYAYTLPIDRRRYAAMRLLVGLLALIGVGVALWVAALATVAVAPVPATLSAYPGLLAIKFTLLALIAFALGAAIAGIPAAGRRWLARGVALALAAQAVLLLLGLEVNFVRPVAEALVSRYGPFGLVAGRWMLIDV